MTEVFRELHERAKESIFWKTFDPKYASDACKSLYELESAIVGYFYGLSSDTRHRNAQWVIVDSIAHNINALMLHIRGGAAKLEGDNIILLQSFLQNLHLLVDDIIPDDPCGLEPYENEGKYRKIKAALNEDGETYRAVQIIKESQITDVIKNLEERITKWFNDDNNISREIREEYQEEIDLLKEGKKLTKWFKVEN